MTWNHALISPLFTSLVITFGLSGCGPTSGTIFFNVVDDDDTASDDDDDIIDDDDDTTSDDDDSATDDDDDSAIPDIFFVYLTTDCDGMDEVIYNPAIYIDEEQVGYSPLITDVIEGGHLFQADSEIILASTYYFVVTEDSNLHFHCGLKPEGLFDLYSEPCGMGGNYIGTFAVGTIIIGDQIKLTVNGEPLYAIIGSRYYADDDLENALGTISIDLTEISDFLDDNCGYLQE